MYSIYNISGTSPPIPIPPDLCFCIFSLWEARFVKGITALKNSTYRFLSIWKSCSQIHSPWIGGYSWLRHIGWSYRHAIIRRLAGRYDNSLSESTLSTQSVTEFGYCILSFFYTFWSTPMWRAATSVYGIVVIQSVYGLYIYFTALGYHFLYTFYLADFPPA